MHQARKRADAIGNDQQTPAGQPAGVSRLTAVR